MRAPMVLVAVLRRVRIDNHPAYWVANGVVICRSVVSTMTMSNVMVMSLLLTWRPRTGVSRLALRTTASSFRRLIRAGCQSGHSFSLQGIVSPTPRGYL